MNKEIFEKRIMNKNLHGQVDELYKTILLDSLVK
jgi:hypothetical protein